MDESIKLGDVLIDPHGARGIVKSVHATHIEVRIETTGQVFRWDPNFCTHEPKEYKHHAKLAALVSNAVPGATLERVVPYVRKACKWTISVVQYPDAVLGFLSDADVENWCQAPTVDCPQCGGNGSGDYPQQAIDVPDDSICHVCAGKRQLSL